MKKIYLALLLLTFTFSCTVPQPETYTPQTIETTNELVLEINKARTANNLKPLIEETLLIELSREKVLQMEQNKQISHDGFSIIKSNSMFLSQIIGFGFQSEKGLFDAYMKSQSHKENILNKTITHIGSYTHNTYNCTLFAYY